MGCTSCNHIFKGKYIGVWYHLLGMHGDKVKAYTLSLEKRVKMRKVHMGTTTNTTNKLGQPLLLSFNQPRLRELSHNRHGSMDDQIQTQSMGVYF
jgi:hypothetical protein